jgi:arylsulfatase A-like enzyme
MVVVDSLRADHVGCYGYARDTTPFLDHIAREGVLFEDVTAQATYTLPSVASMLTSTYPLMMGSIFDPDQPALSLGRDMIMRLPPVTMPVSLQGELKRMGYRTLGWVGGGFLDPLFGFAQGFHSYHAPERKQTIPLAAQLPHIQREVTADPSHPSFLFLHTHDVHNYFQAAGHSRPTFDQGYRGPLSDGQELASRVLSGSAAGLLPADLQHLVDLYDDQIRHTDGLLGAFIEWLLSQPWGDNTVLVITADHGEAFGERGRLHHGHAPHPWLVRVPLIVRLPGGRWQGRRVPGPVSVVDLMPTLIELAGGSAPPGLAGRSLLPLMARGPAAPAPGSAAVPEASPPTLCECSGPILLARQGRWWHYTLLGQHLELLFDLEADPNLDHDLTAAATQAVRFLRDALAAQSLYASRGYRLVVAGPRPGPLELQLRAEAGFSYFLAPTTWQRDALRVSRSSASAPVEAANLTLPTGDDAQVLLFEAVKGAVSITAHMGGQVVGPGRYHLGAATASPERPPVALPGPPVPPQVLADEPPLPAAPPYWGIWVWLPTALAGTQAGQEGVGPLSSSLEDQLRALGYIE